MAYTFEIWDDTDIIEASEVEYDSQIECEDMATIMATKIVDDDYSALGKYSLYNHIYENVWWKIFEDGEEIAKSVDDKENDMKTFILKDLENGYASAFITTQLDKEKIQEVIHSIKQNEDYNSLDLEKALTELEGTEIHWFYSDEIIWW